jgi:hypothetical protein
MWSFDELTLGATYNNEPVKDTSKEGNDGTITVPPLPNLSITAVKDSLNSIIGGALYFDFDTGGTNNIPSLRIPDSASLKVTGDLTIEMWVKPKDVVLPVSNQYLIFKADALGNEFTLQSGNKLLPDKAKLIYIHQNLGPSPLSTDEYVFRTGKWTYVAVVRDVTASKVDFYIDGQLNVTKTYAATDQPLVSSSPVYIHTQSTISRTNSFRGNIDEVRIYSTKLTASQIQKRYAETAPKFQNIAQADDNYLNNLKSNLLNLIKI